MTQRFASSKNARAVCDRCGFVYLLSELRNLVIKQKKTNWLVCPTCWDPDQPQLLLGTFPIDDPQAVKNPRPDTSFLQAGYTGMQVTSSGNSVFAFGYPSGGSRIAQWGWNPVGLSNIYRLKVSNDLSIAAVVASVTIEV